MMKNPLRFLLPLLLLSPSASFASDTPGSYTNYRFDDGTGAGFQSVDFGITVTTDPGFRANTFWSNQFGFVGTSSGAYTGMQSNGGSDRMFLFSVWDATDAKPGSDGSYCIDFGGEGVGESCRMAHAWKQGHSYRFHVASEGGQWFGVTVTDTTDGTAFKLGSIRTASTRISPSGMTNWTEYFEWNAPNASCYDQPYSSALFDLPSADDGSTVARVSSTSVSTSCPATSKVLTEVNLPVKGSLQVNAIGNSVRGAVTGASEASWCLAGKAGATSGTPAITAVCDGSQGQAWVYGSDHTLRLQNNLCLDINGSGSKPGSLVGVYTCTGGTNQRWSRLGSQLRSDWSGLCLSVPGPGGQLTTESCAPGQAGQRWKLPEANAAYEPSLPWLQQADPS